MGINFFLSPFIIENLGNESYAFVKLSNDFIGYISLISVALNSMASRFIAISYMRDDKDEANLYYSSVFYANLIIATVVFVTCTVLIVFLEKLINIPSNLVFDVKILFFMVLVNFVITMLFTVYSLGVFIKNKLYLTSIRTVEAGVFRLIFLCALFVFLKPHIYYISLTTLIISVYAGFYNKYYTKKLTPDLIVRKKNVSFKKIMEVLASGIWNVISQLAYILNEGLDLLIANIFIGPSDMGMLAVAKTLPSMITQVYSNVSSVFMPDFTNLYAVGNYDEMKKAVNNSIKILGVIVNIPVAAIIVFGADFYKLWVPSQDSQILHILSVLTVCVIILSGSTVSIHNIFVVANKVKTNSLVAIGVGILNTAIVLVLLKTTNLGVYAVAGVSSVTSIVRNLVFTFPYAAKCIKVKWHSFYFPAFRGVACCFLTCVFDYAIKIIYPVEGWLSFFLVVATGSFLGLVANSFIVFSKSERRIMLSNIKKKFVR